MCRRLWGSVLGHVGQAGEFTLGVGLVLGTEVGGGRGDDCAGGDDPLLLESVRMPGEFGDRREVVADVRTHCLGGVEVWLLR